MDNEKIKLIADGIRMLIKANYGKIDPVDSLQWLNDYEKIFPKKVPFGGPVNEEDDTS